MHELLTTVHDQMNVSECSRHGFGAQQHKKNLLITFASDSKTGEGQPRVSSTLAFRTMILGMEKPLDHESRGFSMPRIRLSIPEYHANKTQT